MFGRKSNVAGSHPEPSRQDGWQKPEPGQQPATSQPQSGFPDPAKPLTATNAPPRQHPATGDPSVSIIGNNLTMEGDNITIRCQGALQVNGNINAELHCEELTVGETGRVAGSISADDVRVHGRVSGTINGSHVTLYASSEVEGDINSQYLAIERGARFDGRSRRVDEAGELSPQLTNSQANQAATAPVATSVAPGFATASTEPTEEPSPNVTVPWTGA